MSEASRGIQRVVFPQAPKEAAGLLKWAQTLVQSLYKFQEREEKIRVITKAYASALTVDAGAANVFKTTTVNSVGDSTLTVDPSEIDWLAIIVVNDATSGKTITFGSGFKSSGTLVGTASKTAILLFISDGSYFYEVARTTGLS